MKVTLNLDAAELMVLHGAAMAAAPSAVRTETVKVLEFALRSAEASEAVEVAQARCAHLQTSNVWGKLRCQSCGKYLS